MPGDLPRKKGGLSKAGVKAAADRAEMRASGKDPFADDPMLKIGEDEGGAPREPWASPVLDPPETERHPGGRPTKYEPEFCNIAASACARGATINDLAGILKVNRTTIFRWMALHQEFSDSIRIAKEIADERVGFSLYERAVGYSYNSVKIFNDKDNGVTVVPYVEHVLPDVNAQRFWLTNRKPDDWREKKEVTGGAGSTVIIEQRGDLEEARRVAFALGRAFERASQAPEIEHKGDGDDEQG